MYRDELAASMVQLISGLPIKDTIFLFGMPLDPPLAGITASTFLFSITARRFLIKGGQFSRWKS